MQTTTTAPARHSQARRITNNATGEVIEITRTAADTNGAYLELSLTAPAGFAEIPLHIHPRQEEVFQVISGQLGVEIDGKTRVLKPGDEGIIPAGAAHKWWVEGNEPLEFKGRITPALHFAELLDAIYRSASERGSAMPGLVDAAVILQRYRDEYIPVFLPPPVRLMGLPLLALIARLNGRASVVDGWIAAHYR